jgi:hypothetical protein
MQFKGFIADCSILILVDSGSSHSFINSSMASSLPAQCNMFVVMNVRVADGSIIQCNSELPDVEWQVQGYKFHSTL